MNRLTTLAACLLLASTAPAVTACKTVPAASAQQTATKAMIDVEAAFQAAVVAERAAKTAGALSGDKAAQADALVAKAYQGLLVARSAYKAGTSPDIASVLSLVAQVTVLVNGAKA